VAQSVPCGVVKPAEVSVQTTGSFSTFLAYKEVLSLLYHSSQDSACSADEIQELMYFWLFCNWHWLQASGPVQLSDST